MFKSNKFWGGLLHEKENGKEEEEALSDFNARISKLHDILDSGNNSEGIEHKDRLSKLEKDLECLRKDTDEMSRTKGLLVEEELKNLKELKSGLESYKKQMDWNKKSAEETQALKNHDTSLLDERLNAIESLVNELEGNMIKKIDLIERDVSQAKKVMDDLPAAAKNNDNDESGKHLDMLSEAIETEVDKKTGSLKNNILQLANLISLMQKNEHAFKEDIDDLKLMKTDTKKTHDTYKKRMCDIDKKVKDISDKISALECDKKKLEGIIDEISSQKKDSPPIDEIKKNKDKRINDISEMVIGLEDKLEYMKDSIDSLSGNISKFTEKDLDSNLSNLKENISKLSTDLSAVKKDSLNSKKDIDTLKKELEKKISEIPATKQDDSRIKSGQKEEIELIRKTQEIAIQELRDELSKKITSLKVEIEKSGIDRKSYISSHDTGEPPAQHEWPHPTKISHDTGPAPPVKIMSQDSIKDTGDDPKTTMINTVQSHQIFNDAHRNDITLYELIDLIGKTEDLLTSGNIEDAKKTYSYLITASGNVYKNLPSPQAEELYQFIKQLHDKLEMALSK